MLCLNLKNLIITCRVDCGSRVHNIAARGWPWLFPSALLLPQACGHPGQGLYKGEEQGQGVGGETIRERAIQGTGQNPEVVESWGSGCRSNPGQKEARSLQISLVVLQPDTQATVFQWHFLSCPTHHTTGWYRKEDEKHWFSHLCALPLVHQVLASGKQALSSEIA